ncbi:MAG: OmpA family protein [bacterium]|nr:OmpA family protein [bacterium]
MENSHRKRSVARIAAVVAVVLTVGGLIWYTAVRLRELDRNLQASEERAQALNEDLRGYSLELEMALERAKAARQRATSAEQAADAASSARADAEQQAEEADERAQLAAAETERTREEIEQMRERRAAELNRMQEALNRIAPTTRTPGGMVMVLSDEAFRFEFDKATLRAPNRETLSRIAGILLASEGYRLFIDGHTDDVGDSGYNLGLSERRAQSVRDYLVDAGIPEDLIAIQGFGKTEPLDKGKTKAARAKNRRVEIGIVDTIIHWEKRVRND